MKSRLRSPRRRRVAFTATALLVVGCGVYVFEGLASERPPNGGPITGNSRNHAAIIVRIPSGTPVALFPVVVNGKAGFIKGDGELAIPPIFDECGSFTDGLAVARIAGRYGFIDSSGEWRIPPQFTEAGGFSEGLASVRLHKGGKTGYIDKTGSVVIPPQYDWIGVFHNGVALVGVETLWSSIRGAVADVGMKCTYRFIDRQGNTVSYDVALDAGLLQSRKSPHLTPFSRNGRMGFQDANGLKVIPAVFLHAGAFKDGLARVVLADDEEAPDYVYVDESGAIVWPPGKRDNTGHPVPTKNSIRRDS